jgi:putative peptidoglycan lipid II flippase
MPFKRLMRGAATVGSMTLISRVLGFIRDMVIARMFGASAEADAFFVAFKIPNFFRRLTAEGAFSQAFVPVLADIRHKEGEAATHLLLDAVWTRLSLFLLALTLLGMLLAEPIMLLFAPGFATDARLPLSVDMLRITFPYLLLISLTAMLAAVLNSYSRYWEPAFNPVWLNVAMIGAAWLLAPVLDVPAMSLAWGVLLAGFVQLAWVWWALTPVGWRPRFTRAKHEGVGRVLRNMAPALLGVSVAQINLLVSTILASFLIAGSVSWLYYADRLMEFPVGVFGVALATVVLPGLSKARAEGDWDSYNKTLDLALRLIWVVGLPATVALALLSEPLILTLFGYGAFTITDALSSAQALTAYGVGLLGFLAVKVLAPAFYAREQMKVPVQVSVVALLVNLVLALLLIQPLAHIGLALAVSVAALVNAGLLWWALRHKGFYTPIVGWFKLLLQSVLAVCVMAVSLWWLQSTILPDWAAAGGLERAGALLFLVVVGIFSYASALLVFGMRKRHWVLS